MEIIRLAALNIAMFILASCGSSLRTELPDENFPGFFTVRSGPPVPMMFMGSAVQWNEHYAVSVAHIPLLSNVVHHCSTGCDMVFIRHEADGSIPTWRPTVVGERVETVGRGSLMQTVTSSGTSKAQRVRLNAKDDKSSYALNDTEVVQGMSGGPVYAADGAVVGITVGIYQPQLPLPPALKSSKSLSVYVPYEIIQREWLLFSKR